MFGLETTAEMLDPLIASAGPSETDSALVALEHIVSPPENHEANAAPDNPETQETDATTNPSPSPPAFGPLVLSTGTQKNQELDAAGPAPESFLVIKSGPSKNQETDAAAKPAPDVPHDSLLLITGPPENQEFHVKPLLITGPPEYQEFHVKPPQDLPTPRLNFNFAVQHNSNPGVSPQLNISESIGHKRRHSGETWDKARLVPQDVLTTRVAIQEKDRMIEMLKDEVSD
jgi:hypothetical protein